MKLPGDCDSGRPLPDLKCEALHYEEELGQDWS